MAAVILAIDEGQAQFAQMFNRTASTRDLDHIIGATVLTLDAGGQSVIAGLQPFGRSKTALHFVLPSDTVTDRTASQHAVAVWAEELRHRLEEEADAATTERAPAHEAAL